MKYDKPKNTVITLSGIFTAKNTVGIFCLVNRHWFYGCVLCLTKHYAMNRYWESGGIDPRILPRH